MAGSCRRERQLGSRASETSLPTKSNEIDDLGVRLVVIKGGAADDIGDDPAVGENCYGRMHIRDKEIMKKKSSNTIHESGVDNEYEAAAAMIGMISAAKNVALLDLRDEYCVDYLEECENVLRDRYNINTHLVSEKNYDESLREIILLVRMISYVSLELLEKFNDGYCSEIAEQCVQHLMASHGLSSNDLYPPDMMFANVH